VGDLHLDYCPAQFNQFMAPVELERLPWCKALWYVRSDGLAFALSAPFLHIPPDTVIATLKALALQFLKEHHGCPLFSFGLCAVFCKIPRQ